MTSSGGAAGANVRAMGGGSGGGGGCLSTGPFVEGKKNGSHEEKHDNGAVYDVEYDHDRELSRKKRDG